MSGSMTRRDARKVRSLVKRGMGGVLQSLLSDERFLLLTECRALAEQLGTNALRGVVLAMRDLQAGFTPPPSLRVHHKPDEPPSGPGGAA